MKERLKPGDWIKCADREDMKALGEEGYNAVVGDGLYIRITGDRKEEDEGRNEERHAVHIAAVVMEAAGLCLYEDRDLCKSEPTQEGCTACIERWLLQKAGEELRKEAADGKESADREREEGQEASPYPELV